MTDVLYNGVRMQNVLTKLWDAEIVYDESETDMVMQRFRFQFQGLVHLQPKNDAGNVDVGEVWDHAPGFIGPILRSDAPSVNDVGQLYEWIMQRLVEPRKDLIIYVGGTANGDVGGEFVCRPPIPVANANYGNLDWDVSNGPRPLHARLDRIRCDVYQLSFEIECAKLYCHHEDYPPIVLNNRWGIDESADENWVITRKITGQIRMSLSDPGLRTCDGLPATAHGFRIGHWVKEMCVPPLEHGFRRISMDFNLSKDGLKADYQVVDRQVQKAAPWPATKMSGRLVERANATGDKPQSWLECEIHLEGAPGANVTHMLLQGIRLLDLRTKCLADRDKQYYLPVDGTMIEGFGDIPTIDLKVTALKLSEGDEPTAGIGAFFRPNERFGETMRLPADGDLKELTQHISTVPWLWGSNYDGSYRAPTVLLLLQCYLQVPHGQHNMPPVASVAPDFTQPVDVAPELAGTVGDVSPLTDPPPFSDSHKAAIYTMARMESHYIFDMMRVQLPIATTVADNEDEDADTSVVVSLAPCQCRRVIQIDAERTGVWPEIPEPVDTYDDNGLKGTLLVFQATALPPSLAADQIKKVFRMRAYYIYAMNRKPKTEERLRIGVLPFTNFTKDDTGWIPKDSYQQRLDPGDT